MWQLAAAEKDDTCTFPWAVSEAFFNVSVGIQLRNVTKPCSSGVGSPRGQTIAGGGEMERLEDVWWMEDAL